MFRRTFWFTAGAAAGVWATAKVNQKLRQLTPESLAAQAAGKAVEAGHRLREFAVDVRTGMVRREAELGEALGIEAAPGDALPPAEARRQLRSGPRPEPRVIKAVDLSRESAPGRRGSRTGRDAVPRGAGTTAGPRAGRTPRDRGKPGSPGTSANEHSRNNEHNRNEDH